MEIGRIRRPPLAVRLPDRIEGSLAALAGGCRVEHVEGPAHTALDRGDEELLLRAKKPEDVGLRDPDRPRDRIRRTPVEPVRRKLRQCGLEDLLAALLGALSLRDCHTVVLLATAY